MLDLNDLNQPIGLGGRTSQDPFLAQPKNSHRLETVDKDARFDSRKRVPSRIFEETNRASTYPTSICQLHPILAKLVVSQRVDVVNL